SYDVKGLPPFASWSGSTIRVVPTRTDVPGDTTVTVTATDGAHSDSGTFIIGLADSPPSFDGAPQITTWSSQSGRDTATGLPVEATTTSLEVRGGPISVRARAADAEGDDVTLLAELRFRGQPLTGTATHQGSPKPA